MKHCLQEMVSIQSCIKASLQSRILGDCQKIQRKKYRKDVLKEKMPGTLSEKEKRVSAEKG